MNDDLLEYYMEQTDSRLKKIEKSLEDLTEFKIQMIATARTSSLLVSMLCGFCTFAVSIGVSIYLKTG